jgi:hypothetical protein
MLANPLADMHRLSVPFRKVRVLALHPIESLKLPTRDLAEVTVGIHWPFEAFRHIQAMAVTRRSHYFCSRPAAAAGAANEKYLVVLLNSPCCQRRLESFREIGGHPIVWERLPLDQQDVPAEAGKVGDAHERPFGALANIYQNSIRIALETLPRFQDGNVLDAVSISIVHEPSHVSTQR